ncbi:MAG: ArsR family transcriptional regulator [Candidatus Hermodarchaeota archaeon]
MKEKSSDSEVQALILNSLAEITDLLKSITHPKRLHILALLINTSKKFSFLLSETKISKTALANHIRNLINTGLIEKIDRGSYEITKDGRELLKATASTYHELELRNVAKMEQLREEYIRFYKNIDRTKQITEKIVSADLLYPASCNSYISSVSGVLKALGVDSDIIDISGRSGYSFIVNVEKGGIIGTGPLSIHDEAQKEISKGFESFGWKINTWKKEGGYPQDTMEVKDSNDDFKRALELFNYVKQVIDEYDTPVILWGIPEVSNYGIVKGYTVDSYIVETYKEDTSLIRFNEIQAPLFLSFYYFTRENSDQSEENADKNSLARAIKMAKGTKVARAGYVAGPSAYDEWAVSLESVKPAPAYIYGIGFTIEAYHEAKGFAATYLERLAEKYKEFSYAKSLIKAAREYRECKKLFNNFIEDFPFFVIDVFPFFNLETVKLTPDIRKRGADLLREIKKHEIAAIGYLEEANRKWSKQISG